MATIRDIAKLANVSASTVSRVLNLDETIKVTLQTRKRIFEAAEQLSYQKPVYAPKPHFNRYALIHWYNEFEEMNDPFFLSIRLGIERECQSVGVILEKYYNNESKHTFETNRERFEGLIILGKFSDEHIERFSQMAKKIVLVHNYSKNFIHDSIIVDFKQLTRDVIDAMAAKGFRKIGFIGGREGVVGSDGVIIDDREVEFFEYAGKLGILNEKYIRIGKFGYNDGYNMMRSILERPRDLPECIFIASDTLAIGALRALREADVKVPDSISIISCNGIPASEYTAPSLSTVRIHTEFMGSISAKLFLEQDDRDEKIRVVIPHELVIRESFK